MHKRFAELIFWDSMPGDPQLMSYSLSVLAFSNHTSSPLMYLTSRTSRISSAAITFFMSPRLVSQLMPAVLELTTEIFALFVFIIALFPITPFDLFACPIMFWNFTFSLFSLPRSYPNPICVVCPLYLHTSSLGLTLTPSRLGSPSFSPLLPFAS